MYGPYVAYCTKYTSGFDGWNPVLTNSRLSVVLRTFSSSNPPPLTSSSEEPVWTLDMLFSLPRDRVKYYYKLYGKLLRNAMRGGSTDKLLTAAVEKLGDLDAKLEQRFTSEPHSLLRREDELNAEEDEVIISPGHLSQRSLESPVDATSRDSAGSSLHSISNSSGLVASRKFLSLTDHFKAKIIPRHWPNFRYCGAATC